MARQDSNGHGVRPSRGMTTGAAMLDIEEADARETQSRHLLQQEVLRVASALKQGHLAETGASQSVRGWQPNRPRKSE